MDVSKLEIVAFCIRYCDDEFHIHENLLGLFDTPTATSEVLFNLIIHLLDSLKLNNEKYCLVGQAYDGVATMSGLKSGVAKRILEIHDAALYVHCHNHKLNLALCAASSKDQACRFDIVRTNLTTHIY